MNFKVAAAMLVEAIKMQQLAFFSKKDLLKAKKGSAYVVVAV